MDREAALESLPGAYAKALRLRDGGLTTAEIARRLKIPPEAVSSTLELAQAKLERRLVAAHESARRSP
ncbi:MAG TPA: sigma factor-like helix-turn-helix DNA-binding protein [Solirubrobacteraceae bacterium]|nr:sigma factor-like helix-turn-helix DNA-binding protein [Solirubrobacteraceae bacterium]